MNIGELIKELAQYDFDTPVVLANLSDDSGESDETLTARKIHLEDDGYLVISHSKPSEE